MADNDVETINCPIGKWYFKRMTLLGLLMLGFGAWFLFDGLVGYPKSQVKAVAYEAFEVGSESGWEDYAAKAETKLSKAQLSEADMEVVRAAHVAGGQKATWEDFALKKKIDTGEPAADSEHRKLYDAFKAGGTGGTTWDDYATANGLPVEAGATSNAFEDGGKDREWAPYAAVNDLPSDEPHFHGKGDIFEQLLIGGLCAAAGLAALLIMTLNKSRSVKADAEAYYPKPSIKVPFADVFKIDTRKWRRKGLAYAYYKGRDGDEKKAVLDDLKFIGTQSILDRMVDEKNFEGKLIEEIVDDEDDDDTAEGQEDPANGDEKSK